MWSRDALCDRLDLDRLIVQAPMAGSSTPELAAAVSNAGGLGSLGQATMPVEEADDQIVAFRSLCERSLNVNFFCHLDPGDLAGVGDEMRARLRPYYRENGLGEVPLPSLPFASFGPAHLDLIRRHRPQVVSFHFVLPRDDLLRTVKETGAVVMSSATTVAEACWLEAHGADAVIAQAWRQAGIAQPSSAPNPQARPVCSRCCRRLPERCGSRCWRLAVFRMVKALPPRCCLAPAVSSSARRSCDVPKRQ